MFDECYRAMKQNRKRRQSLQVGSIDRIVDELFEKMRFKSEKRLLNVPISSNAMYCSDYHPRSGGVAKVVYVFSRPLVSVYGCVCLSVCQHDNC